MGIGELSPSKFKYETDFIKFSECQVPMRKRKPPIQDFLATVLVFKLHIFSRYSLVVFDPYHPEKVRNTRSILTTLKKIVDLTVTTMGYVLRDVFCSCRHTYYIGAASAG